MKTLCVLEWRHLSDLAPPMCVHVMLPQILSEGLQTLASLYWVLQCARAVLRAVTAVWLFQWEDPVGGLLFPSLLLMPQAAAGAQLWWWP